jgi:hypothetical protein
MEGRKEGRKEGMNEGRKEGRKNIRFKITALIISPRNRRKSLVLSDRKFRTGRNMTRLFSEYETDSEFITQTFDKYSNGCHNGDKNTI